MYEVRDVVIEERSLPQINFPVPDPPFWSQDKKAFLFMGNIRE
jgi:hypothetical protein